VKSFVLMYYSIYWQ